MTREGPFSGAGSRAWRFWTISREVAEVLQRMGSSAESWQARLEQLKRRGGRLLGRSFAVTRERLRAVATQGGVHHLANLGGCPAG